MKVATGGFGVAALFYLVTLIARTEASCPSGQYKTTGCIGLAHNFGGSCSTYVYSVRAVVEMDEGVGN